MLLLDFFKERNGDRLEALPNKIMVDLNFSLKFLESSLITSKFDGNSLDTKVIPTLVSTWYPLHFCIYTVHCVKTKFVHTEELY